MSESPVICPTFSWNVAKRHQFEARRMLDGRLELTIRYTSGRFQCPDTISTMIANEPDAVILGVIKGKQPIYIQCRYIVHQNYDAGGMKYNPRPQEETRISLHLPIEETIRIQLFDWLFLHFRPQPTTQP